jgi:predicted RNA-binding Zn-ribbon protein involved in translation (DUF1610 family)
MKFRGRMLAGEWTCEKCGGLAQALQISTLTDGFRCPKCGNPLVFVPTFRPVSDELAREKFAELKKQIL